MFNSRVFASDRFSIRSFSTFASLLMLTAVATGWCSLGLAPSTANAQNVNFGNQIGGVLIDAQGIVNAGPQRLDAQLHARLVQDVAATDGLFADVAAADGKPALRKLSLKQLNAIVQESARTQQAIPAQARYLAGLMRIENIIVDHKNNDIVLAGPAEELVVSDNGSIVGKSSRSPALHLQDLMTALQSAEAAINGKGISVSIDATDEARVAFRDLVGRAAQQNAIGAPLTQQLEQAMGPHQVVLTGVPANSRFANVLALADYRMKRISMGLDPSPLKALPSFVSMLSKSNLSSALTPRFWMEMDYNPLTRSEDGNVWHLSGTGVKTMTENDIIAANGASNASGAKNPLADKWAKAMTKNYNDLISQDSIFGELRNLFDMSVAVAVIHKERLAEKAGLNIDSLLGKADTVNMNDWNEPKQTPTAASLIHSRRGTVVTASGGVQLDPWTVVSNVKVDDSLASLASEVTQSDGKKLFWN